MNVILEHRIEKNTKLNKIARIGYFCTSTYDPFGVTSFIFAIILWYKNAGKRQYTGFLVCMLVHIIATAIFDRYFTTTIDSIIYGVLFEMILPFTLYRMTKAPILELLESQAFTTSV